MEKPSTEKVYKHDITPTSSGFECQACSLQGETMDAIVSQPCNKGKFRCHQLIPDGHRCFEKVDSIKHSPTWDLELVGLIGSELEKPWEITTKCGEKIAVVCHSDHLQLERALDSTEFPILVQPAPKDEELAKELEMLKVQEELLAEMLLLEDLENQAKGNGHANPEVYQNVPVVAPAAPTFSAVEPSNGEMGILAF